jgi:hypothetical protein
MSESPEKPASKFFSEKHCVSSAEFIAALSLRSSSFKSALPRGWIFRGQANNDHPLIPSALRSEAQKTIEEWSAAKPNNKNQILYERQVLKDFLKVADSIGLNLPEDTQKLRIWLNRGAQHICVWPVDEVLSLMGLAQHHGLPTRLLDWSRHPLKAAWFAAAEAAQFNDKNGLLCVWALSVELLEMIDEGPKPFIVVTTPAASNSNLRAQEGLFTLAKHVRPDDDLVNRLPFDQLLRTEFDRVKLVSQAPWFHKITLPLACAEELEFDLALEGITRAKLFPDFGGVARTIKDTERWMRKGGPGQRRLDEHLESFAIVYKGTTDIASLFPKKPGEMEA